MITMRTLSRLLSVLMLPLLITACAGEPPAPGIKIGKPYQIYGKWYKPAFESDYDEVGIASWYGPGFHGNYTASGERFDKNSLTAAHTTLPMPSMVRVTNLANNRSVIVRINDRGPFAENRIIDLSKKAAQELDMLKTGTAKVRVQYLHDETEKYLVDNNIKGREKIISARDLNRRQLDTMDGRTSETVEAAPVAPVGQVTINTSPTPHSSDKVEVTEVAFVDGSSPSPAPVVSEPVRPISPSSHVKETVEDAEIVESKQGLSKAFDYVDNEPQAAASKPVSVSNAVSSTSDSGIFIQAGTFGSKSNAEKLADKLSSQGDTNIAEVNVQDKVLYRVRMGPLPSIDDASATLQKIHQMGITDARLIRN